MAPELTLRKTPPNESVRGTATAHMCVTLKLCRKGEPEVREVHLRTPLAVKFS